MSNLFEFVLDNFFFLILDKKLRVLDNVWNEEKYEEIREVIKIYIKIQYIPTTFFSSPLLYSNRGLEMAIIEASGEKKHKKQKQKK